MAKLAIPDSPKLYTTRYDNLRGLDVANPPTEISTYHAADMLNIIPDKDNGVPSKRVGWRYVHQFDHEVVATYHDVEDNFDLIATKKELWKYDVENETYTKLYTGAVESDKASITPFMNNIYITGWGEYKEIKAPNYNAVTDIDEYIPNTVISRKQDGTSGFALEGINAFSTKRIISFLSDADPETTPTNADYIVYPKTDWENHTFTIVSVEATNATTGAWETVSYTAKSENGRVVGFTLTTAHKQVVLGQDDVRVTINEPYTQTIKSEIANTDIVTSYGLNTMDRLFFASGHKIYYTDAEKPNFVPDDNYIVVGSDVPIVGLHRFNGYLVAITEDTSEFSVYMIHGQQQSIARTVYGSDGTVTSESELMTYFAVRASIAGTGAIATKSFETLVDDPLFLAKTGIYGITTTALNTETVITNRSFNINPWLIDEDEPTKACACIWRGFYVLALNGRAYILDSRNTVRTPTGTGYECYFWDDIPATAFLSYDDNLFFGDDEGNWCRLNTDIASPVAWCDGGTLVDGVMQGGRAISARYTLRMDYDNAPQYFKILTKKGTVVELFPYGRSGASIYAKKDNGNKQLLKNQVTNIFAFNNVDFNNFSFTSDTSSRFIYTKKKIKKYKTLQIIIENNNINERFGVVSVTKTYTIGNFAKG